MSIPYLFSLPYTKRAKIGTSHIKPMAAIFAILVFCIIWSGLAKAQADII
jgi:hypothetical protein